MWFLYLTLTSRSASSWVSFLCTNSSELWLQPCCLKVAQRFSSALTILTKKAHILIKDHIKWIASLCSNSWASWQLLHRSSSQAGRWGARILCKIYFTLPPPVEGRAYQHIDNLAPSSGPKTNLAPSSGPKTTNSLILSQWASCPTSEWLLHWQPSQLIQNNGACP